MAEKTGMTVEEWFRTFGPEGEIEVTWTKQDCEAVVVPLAFILEPNPDQFIWFESNYAWADSPVATPYWHYLKNWTELLVDPEGYLDISIGSDLFEFHKADPTAYRTSTAEAFALWHSRMDSRGTDKELERELMLLLWAD